jgi:hypothetical protein
LFQSSRITAAIAAVSQGSTGTLRIRMHNKLRAPYAAARQAGSESRFQLIDDTDVAGTIPYLPKG